MKKRFVLALSFASAFFIIAFATLKDYGVSWDEAIHFRRGQAYLHYFLTRETNYENLPNPDLQGTKGDPKEIPIPRRSFYQNDFHNAEFFLKDDVGHPPINDEFAALLNYIFYQKLGVLDDISAHHLFNILASALLVFVVCYFTHRTFGNFTAIVSSLALVTYPLFFAESHFNIKDPPEAAFFAATIWAFFESLEKFSPRWLFLSFIFLALALGTKFNAVFLLFILVPYVLYRYRKNLKNFKKFISSIPKNYLKVLLICPFLVLGILVCVWPFLWQAFPNNLLKIFGFYKEIGTGFIYQPDKFFVLGFNTYPIQWIFFTTPPLILFLSGIGIVSAWRNRKKYKQITLLWLLWLVIPIVRVTIPGTVIYGGVRQIMEFVPAMALLSGLGAKWLFDKLFAKLSSERIAFLLIILPFTFLIFNLYKMHPNQNVYFNSFIGGLGGAKKRDFPSWGNSYGNAHLAGIKWLNENVEDNAKLALIQGTPANAPLILLRSDIDFKNANFSGIERDGEYLMDLTFNDTTREFNYAWEYVERFLEPVYELRVDEVAILTIWKNDLEHTRDSLKLKEVPYRWQTTSLLKEDSKITLALKNEVTLSRVSLSYKPFEGCFPIATSYMETSLDGIQWSRERDIIPSRQLYREENLDDETITFFFAAKGARYVRFWLDNSASCGLGTPEISVTILEEGIL